MVRVLCRSILWLGGQTAGFPGGELHQRGELPHLLSERLVDEDYSVPQSGRLVDEAGVHIVSDSSCNSILLIFLDCSPYSIGYYLQIYTVNV